MRAEVTEIADDNMWLEPRIAQVAHILSGRLLSAMMWVSYKPCTKYHCADTSVGQGNLLLNWMLVSMTQHNILHYFIALIIFTNIPQP